MYGYNKGLIPSKMTSGKNKKNLQIYTAEEFTAAITQYIPEKSFQMVKGFQSCYKFTKSFSWSFCGYLNVNLVKLYK